jgi:hypothetical protein
VIRTGSPCGPAEVPACGPVDQPIRRLRRRQRGNGSTVAEYWRRHRRPLTAALILVGSAAIALPTGLPGSRIVGGGFLVGAVACLGAVKYHLLRGPDHRDPESRTSRSTGRRSAALTHHPESTPGAQLPTSPARALGRPSSTPPAPAAGCHPQPAAIRPLHVLLATTPPSQVATALARET